MVTLEFGKCLGIHPSAGMGLGRHRTSQRRCPGRHFQQRGRHRPGHRQGTHRSAWRAGRRGEFGRRNAGLVYPAGIIIHLFPAQVPLIAIHSARTSMNPSMPMNSTNTTSTTASVHTNRRLVTTVLRGSSR